MNNYEKMQEAARLRFLEYDYDVLCRRQGVTVQNHGLATCFLGQAVTICRETGSILVDGRPANFSESLTIYDWLCDRKEAASSAGTFCTVSSLPGVFVAGSGLSISGNAVAPLIGEKKTRFLSLCRQMQGREVDGADLAVVIEAFPGLPVLLKFYDADENFPASLALLWDANILQFIRYETVYYLAGCLLERIRGELK